MGVMATYDQFARQYADAMGEKGDYFHRTQIDPCIYRILGDPKGKLIYDVGCGNGYMARNLANKGARVFASDVAPELVKIAVDKSRGLAIDYSVRDGADFTGFRGSQFDVVVMNMVIHYLRDLDQLFAGVAKVLKNGGKFIFSTNHFFRPNHPYSDWVKGKIGFEEKLFIRVTNYLEEYPVRVKSWWDEKTELTIINRPLGSYVNTLSKYSLLVEKIEEPESIGFAKAFSEKLQKSHHIPTFIIFGTVKVSLKPSSVVRR